MTAAGPSTSSPIVSCNWSSLDRCARARRVRNRARRANRIQSPLKEVGGKVFKSGLPTIEAADRLALPPSAGGGQSRRPRHKKGRTKTPAGTRLVELPPSIASFYEELLDSHRHPFVMCTPEGRPWRRSNFRQRYWRPAWDGRNMDDPVC